jgi:hypothetical protein
MQKRAALTLLIAGCTQSRSTASSPAPIRCIPIADATAQATRAGQRNDQRFQEQLTQKGLELVAFATAGVEYREQTEITVETRTIGGVAQRVLLTPSSTCATGALQLAKNAQQELFALTVHRRATNDAITACACQPEVSTSCGGAAVAPITVHYAVPDELTYKGTVDIEYDVEPDSLLYSGRQPDGGACPPPPPPPP